MNAALLRWVLCVVAMLVSPASARAVVLVTLTSPTPNLNSLMVGDTVTFEVTLSNIADSPTPGELEELNAQLSYNSAILGPPTISFGPIITDPGPPALVVTELPGTAAVSYSGLFSGMYPFANITSDGLFFSFTALVIGPGTDDITFDSLGTSARDGFGIELLQPSEFDFAGSLSYTALGPSATIPEPASLLTWGLLGSCLVGWRWRKRQPGPRQGTGLTGRPWPANRV